MKIDKVTISGADDKVSPSWMWDMQEMYPFVEWGILVSQKRAGQSRYPSENWMMNLPYQVKVSLHLCGQVCRDFVDDPKQERLYIANGDHFDRVQLNVAFKEQIDYLSKLQRIEKVAEQLPQKAIIIPYNKMNKTVVDTWLGTGEIPENIHFLYDSSGGRGRVISSIEKPLLNYTGYAGGIDPDNIVTICSILTNEISADNVWIDMESGVRTNDELDLKKVEKVLSICAKYILPNKSIHA